MQTGLAGRAVLITGAASGIRRATAIAFAREGANVAMIDQDRAELEATATTVRSAGVRAVPVAADLATLEGVESSIDSILAQVDGGPDILVNNVGFADAKPFSISRTSTGSAPFR